MAKFLRITGYTALIAIAVMALLAFLAWRATQQVPDFYRDALALTPTQQKAAGKNLEKEVLQLRNDARHSGRWEAVFTQDQINGWLAIDLLNKFPNALPSELSEPRVAIDNDQIRIACRYQGSKFKTVLSLILEVSMTQEPNVVAVRICKARAGSLPLPMKSWLDQISEAARKSKIPLRWSQNRGDPVALVTLPHSYRELKKRKLLIESIALRDGAISLSGRTDDKSLASQTQQATAVQSPPKRTRQQ